MEINLDTLEIEIVDTHSIEGGIEVFARAWSDGVQIGFGKDGTVDIERFRFFNPPLLVDDQNGDIVQISDKFDPITGETTRVERRLREDPNQALLLALVETIAVKSELRGAEAIVGGKVGNTTTTIYSEPHVETTSSDGLLYRNGPNGTFASHRDATTCSAVIDNVSTQWGAVIGTLAVSGQFYYFYRAFFGFNTSAIGTDTVSSATLSISGNSKQDPASWGLGFSIIPASPSSNTAMVADDFNNVTFSRAATDISYASFNTSGYNDWSLNSTGISHINKTGTTFYAQVTSADIDNTAPTWSSGVIFGCDVDYAEQTGTASDPKLVVEHSAATPSNPTGFSLFF